MVDVVSNVKFQCSLHLIDSETSPTEMLLMF